MLTLKPVASVYAIVMADLKLSNIAAANSAL